MSRALIPYQPKLPAAPKRDLSALDDLESLSLQARCAVARIQARIEHAVRQERSYAGR